MADLTLTPSQPTVTEATPHQPVRRFVGSPGVWIRVHGEWCRPLHVWLYRGAWRVACRLCWPNGALWSGDDLWGGGWATQAEAFDAAHAHGRAHEIGMLDAARAVKP